jgi:hypothetical protein
MPPEMRAFEYALGLFSVLVGLAIADIATSFHRLARGRQAVRWDPLAIAAALYALLTAIGMWFDLWGVRNVSGARHFFFYLLMIVELFLVFLIAAASLPDDLQSGSDLREYYALNRRYFWGLIALFQVGYILLGLYFVGGLLSRSPIYYTIAFAAQMTVLLLTPVVLAVSRSRLLHYSGLALLFATQAWHYAPYSIN